MHTFERNCSFGLNIRYAECSNRGLGVSRSKIRKAYVNYAEGTDSSKGQKFNVFRCQQGRWSVKGVRQ